MKCERQIIEYSLRQKHRTLINCELLSRQLHVYWDTELIRVCTVRCCYLEEIFWTKMDTMILTQVCRVLILVWGILLCFLIRNQRYFFRSVDVAVLVNKFLLFAVTSYMFRLFTKAAKKAKLLYKYKSVNVIETICDKSLLFYNLLRFSLMKALRKSRNI